MSCMRNHGAGRYGPVDVSQICHTIRATVRVTALLRSWCADEAPNRSRGMPATLRRAELSQADHSFANPGDDGSATAAPADGAELAPLPRALTTEGARCYGAD